MPFRRIKEHQSSATRTTRQTQTQKPNKETIVDPTHICRHGRIYTDAGYRDPGYGIPKTARHSEKIEAKHSVRNKNNIFMDVKNGASRHAQRQGERGREGEDDANLFSLCVTPWMPKGRELQGSEICAEKPYNSIQFPISTLLHFPHYTFFFFQKP
jgi:hypothetical protein